MTEDLISYIDKCRCCYDSIEDEENFLQIDKTVENQFQFVFNLELISSTHLSNRVCKQCQKKLLSFYVFKQEIVAKQEKLYELLERKVVVKLEDLSDENDSPAVFEPSVVIKTEGGLDYNPPQFIERIDYATRDQNWYQYETAKTKTRPPAVKTQKQQEYFEDSVDKYVKHRDEKIAKVKNHPCPECHKYFHRKSMVKSHVKRVHNQTKDFKCDACDYRAHLKWDLMRHYKAQHLPPDPDPKNVRICPDCGKVFKGTNKLNYHIKMKHSTETKFACDLCDFKTYGKYYIRSHIVIHHMPLELRKSFPCDQCSAVLTSTGSLKTHKTHKHSGLRPHKCFCGKSYPLPQTLRSHIKIVHGGDRKFKCSQCDKDFPTSMQLKSHSMVHEARQEVPCEKCGKMFSSARNLNKHMIFHQPPAFPCNSCEKSFYVKKRLSDHQDTVHGGVTFNCELCNRSFQSTSGLRRHKKTHLKS